MRYLVAVSGGIDSVVLLDILAKNKQHELTVAHFDHGIRPDSADDARFVAGLASKYGVSFITKREELGKHASEDLARTRRYKFLRDEAKKRGTIIVTAHHLDDVIESIAINLTRGTGWRGLAVLDSMDIWRPLRHVSKRRIREYAREHRLEWTEDSTNASSKYLRNRLRKRIQARLSPSQKQKVMALWQRQIKLKNQISEELKPYIREEGVYSRHMLTMIDELTAMELVRSFILAKTGLSPTRPQIERALIAIKTGRAGSVFEISAGVTLRFTANTFIVGEP